MQIIRGRRFGPVARPALVCRNPLYEQLVGPACWVCCLFVFVLTKAKVPVTFLVNFVHQQVLLEVVRLDSKVPAPSPRYRLSKRGGVVGGERREQDDRAGESMSVLLEPSQSMKVL